MTFTNLRPYTIALISAALAMACSASSNGPSEPSGSGGGGNGGDKNAVMPGTICQRVAEIQCAAEAQCCTNPGRDAATCTAAQKKVCSETLSLDDAAANPIAAFDAAKAKAALDQFESLATKCDTSISAFALGTSGFRTIAVGTVAPGGACDPASSSNKLAATAAALASCTGPATNACLPAMTGGWKCAPRSDAGGPCFTDANCKEGLACDNPNLRYDGTCKARKPAGADCMEGTTECSSFACKDGKCVDQTKDTAYCLAQ
jgi:hypothetical protein